jgi:toxin FitB
VTVLLDTNIISELTKPAPHAGVVHFLQGLEQAFVSVLTLHELQYGIARLPLGRRRTELARTIERFISAYDDAILAINRPEALRAGELRATAQANGQVVHVADALIAATALEHGLALATRNVADFSGCGLSLINPWDGP